MLGDDVVVNLQVVDVALPSNQMTCEQVFHFLKTKDKFPIAYCGVENFKKTCCNTCNSKKF